MARDLIETVHRTMGSHVVMFIAHEAGEDQIKIAVFETAPGDGKKAFTQSSESSKDWVLDGESSLTNYLLTAPVEDDSAEKHEVEISLDEDGNLEMPTWSGQKLKVQQNLARAVFQAAYAKFTKKPKARVPWGLLIESPMEYLDSQSIPEGFMMKDPSKWTKADLGLLWDHWQTLETEEKETMDPEDDSEEEVGEEGVHSGQMMKSGEVVNKGVEATMDVRDQAPEESSPAWHASKDCIQYLKSLSIMPRYQVLVDLVEALPEEEHGKGREEIHLESTCFWKALGELQSARFKSSSLGEEMVLGLGPLLRECSHAQEVEEDDPLVSHLQFLLNSELGIQKVENVMDIVGLIVVRLEQSAGMKEPQEGDEGAGMGGTDREDEKEDEEVPPVVPTQKWKRAERDWGWSIPQPGRHLPTPLSGGWAIPQPGQPTPLSGRWAIPQPGPGGWAIPQPGGPTPLSGGWAIPQPGGPTPLSGRWAIPQPGRHTPHSGGWAIPQPGQPTPLSGGWAIPQPGWPTPLSGGWAIPQPGWPTPLSGGWAIPQQGRLTPVSGRWAISPARLAYPTFRSANPTFRLKCTLWLSQFQD
ncbi:hypothetical protein EDC04DRAFT_2906776 [Pisolithus marmoratus]|nr:hypothetical protein EDC04DRAFT_2906776 [Pisolithus marmoratus]